MSLINKMLQDLDARRSEVTGSGLLGSQIRVVVRRGNTPIVWWIAGLLALALAVLLAWIFFHPASEGSQVRAAKQPILPVKSAPVHADKFPQAIVAPAKTETVSSAKAVEPVVPTAESANKNSTSVTQSAIPEMPAVIPKLPAVSDKLTKHGRPNLPTPEELMARAEPSLPHVASLPKASRPLEIIVPQDINKRPTSGPQQRADSEYRKALVLREQGKSSEAISSLEQSLQINPQFAAARQVLIGMLIDGNRQEDALQRAQEGLELDPAQSGLAMIASRLQLEKGNLKPAIETLERSLRYALDRADYQAYLAALLQRDGRNKEAVEHYLVAVRQSPQMGVWWMGLGISLQADNRLPEAREAFGRAKDSGTLSPELVAFVDSKLKQLPR